MNNNLKRLVKQQANNRLIKPNKAIKNHSSEFSLVALFKEQMTRVRVSSRTLIEFTKSLAALVGAEIPLHKALTTVYTQTNHRGMKTVLLHLQESVERGMNLSIALTKYPQVFDPLYIQLIKVGETSSNLGLVLTWLSIYLEKSFHLRKKILTSLYYPIILVFVSLIVVVCFISFVLPGISQIFSDFGAELPTSVLLIVRIGKLMPYIVNVTLMLIAILGIIVYKTGNWQAIVSRFDKYVIALPVMGPIVKKNHVSMFCRALGLLIKSGNSLSDSLRVSVKISPNSYFRSKLEHCIDTVNKGKSLAYSLMQTDIFPDMVPEMISIGETTAKLEDILVYIAEFYDKELDTVADTISAVIEPIIITAVGLFISIIIISLYLPLFDLVNIINY
ncbi:MAG TPA: type II secretion system F family protein [Candidatus Cloacimonadota bacterium]|jgi:type IV pilus assembly protein PilC|nr:type II secretion system F family protein [Candidatus Cloacimonadota bacterium]